MQLLIEVFTRDIPPELRRRVLEAITTKPLAHGYWIDDEGNDCLTLTAANAVSSYRIGVCSINPLGPIANALRIDAGRVADAVVMWDKRMTPADRADFITRMRIELFRLDHLVEPPVVPIRRNLPARARRAFETVSMIALAFFR